MWELWVKFLFGIKMRSICAKSLQLCLTLCDSVDHSPPGSSIHGIIQTRILEWVAMPFSRGSSQPRDRTQVCDISCIGRQEPCIGRIPWRRAQQLSPGFLPGESHGQGNLVGYSHRVAESQTWLKRLGMACRMRSIALASASQIFLRNSGGTVSMYVILDKGEYRQSSTYFSRKFLSVSWRLLLVMRSMCHWAFLDRRSYKNWTRNIGSWEYLIIWRPVLPGFLWSQSASFLLLSGSVENQQL